jgi:hypothetical protein
MALFVPAARVSAQTPTAATGKMDGQVINGTKDAKVQDPASLLITLYSADMGATSATTQTTKSDANGKFSFSNLGTGANARYLLTTSYLGVDYATDVLQFDPGMTVLTPTLQVHETTNDPKVVNVMQTHFVFDVQTRQFNIIEIIQIVNMSDRAYIGARNDPHSPTLLLPVLAGAQNIQFDTPTVDGTTLRGDGVLTYTLPFAPGMDQIVFNYTIPFNPPTYDFKLKATTDIGTLRLLLSDVNTNIKSTQFLTPTLFPTQGGQTFLLTSATGVTAGSEVKATFANLPASVTSPTAPGGAPATTPITAGPDNTTLIGGVVLGIAGIAALGLIGFAMTRRRAQPIEEDEEEEITDEERRVELLQELADLDDDFEAKKITEEEYKKQRAEIKTELRELMKASEVESKE